MSPQSPIEQPNAFRGTWTYAPDAVYTPRSIFRAKPAPAATAPAPSANTTTASATAAHAPPERTPAAPPERTPESYMSETEFADRRTAILEALAPFPDAHMAVVAALRRAAGLPD
jgi:hypothetical protein